MDIHDETCEPEFADRSSAYLVDGRWAPKRTDDYDADCRHGHDVADRIVSLMRSDDNPLHLHVAARAIVEGGRWEAVEIGLFSRLAMLLQ